MRTITEVQLRDAILALDLPQDSADRILAAVPATPTRPETPQHTEQARFETAHIAYYLGALLIIGAMGWFITNAWDSLHGLTIFAIAAVYALVFGATGAALYRKPATRIPGGLLVTVAVCMTPLAVYGIERQLGWWPSTDPGSYTNFHPYIHGSWLLMEAVTILVAAIALRYIRFAFITAPAAYALWYMSMDATALLFARTWTFHEECWISIIFGLIMLITAYVADRETDVDLAFWFYLFGLLAFCGGLTLLGDGDQLRKAIYCLINLTLMVLAIILQRRAFLVFGAIGVFIYLANEATGYFRNSFSFTIALTLIGIAFLAAGILYKRSEAQLTARLAPYIPARVRHRHALTA
jgi:hypothetical protein